MDISFKRKSEETLESLKTKQRVVLDAQQKREIILFHDSMPSFSQQKLADYFSEKFQLKTKIARNTISTILSKRNIYLNETNAPLNAELSKQSKNPLLQKCLILWYSNLLGKKVVVTNEMIVDQAKKFGHLMGIADFTEFDLTIERLDDLKREYDLMQPSRKLNFFDSDDLENSNFDENSPFYNEKTSIKNEEENDNLDNLKEETDVENGENNGDSNYLDEIAELAKETDYNEAINEPYESNTNYHDESYENPANTSNNEALSSDISWKKKRVVLDLDAKRQIILFSMNNPSWSQQKLADYFSEKFQFKSKIARNTISTILSKKSIYLQTENNGGNDFSQSFCSKNNYLPNKSNQTNQIGNNVNGQNFPFVENNDANEDRNLTIEEIIELAKESENNELVNHSNDDEEDDNYESTSIKIEPKIYSKGEALLGIENIQGLLIQEDLLDENDLEYISKLRSKFDLIN